MSTTAEKTSNGLRVGSLLVGPIEEKGRKYVWSVTRVLSREKVELVARVGTLSLRMEKLVGHGNSGPFIPVYFVDDPDASVVGHYSLGRLVRDE